VKSPPSEPTHDIPDNFSQVSTGLPQKKAPTRPSFVLPPAGVKRAEDNTAKPVPLPTTVKEDEEVEEVGV